MGQAQAFPPAVCVELDWTSLNAFQSVRAGEWSCWPWSSAEKKRALRASFPSRGEGKVQMGFWQGPGIQGAWPAGVLGGLDAETRWWGGAPEARGGGLSRGARVVGLLRALPAAAGGPALPQGPCVCRVRMLVGVARTCQSQEACSRLCGTQPPPQCGPFPKCRSLSLAPRPGNYCCQCEPAPLQATPASR